MAEVAEMDEFEKRKAKSQKVMACQRRRREDMRRMAAGLLEVLDILPDEIRSRAEAVLADRVQIARNTLAPRTGRRPAAQTA